MSDEINVKVTKYADRKNWIMYYIDPVTEKTVPRSTKRTNQRDAERAAAKWEADLRAGRYHADSRITWSDFRERYESEKLSSLAVRSLQAASAAMNHLERVIDPKRLSSITSATMSRFQADLRAEGMKDTTIAAHLGHLRAAMGWAVSMGFLPKVPDMHRPKRAKGRKLMRGRPVTGEEFDRMLKAVPEVRPHDAPQWERYLRGLWLSGLRLEESTIFSWDLDAPFSVDLTGKHPRFRIYAEAEKGHQDRLLPMTPDLADFLLKTPEAERQGPVFPLIGLQTARPMTPKRIGRILTKIGEKARVIVNRDTRVRKKKVKGVVKTVKEEVTKYASAHDLRRAFGTRWAPRVKQATLRLLMRHRSIETTLAYYVDIDADDVADELWRAHGSINTSINSPENPAPHSEETPPQETKQPLIE